MARKPTEKVNGVVTPPDFELAKRIYDKDIAPANKAQKQAMQEASAGWKEVKNGAHVHVSGFRQAAKVANMEDAEQQAWLRSFRAGCEQFNVGLNVDLVDVAEGVDASNTIEVVPSKQAASGDLHLVN